MATAGTPLTLGPNAIITRANLTIFCQAEQIHISPATVLSLSLSVSHLPKKEERERIETLMAEDMFVVNAGADVKEEGEKLLMDGVAVLDFDMLCSAVAAMQTQGKCKWTKLDNQADHENSEFGGEGGGVLRMWEGDLLNCLDDRPIALESACCPCYRFGKNMRRAGFGFCFIQGIVYMTLAVAALVSMTTFIVTRRHCFLYLGVVFTISVGAYLGFYRTQITKKFNIRGNDSLLDDCLYHLVCPCCTLSQESRTLETNNVQDGTWHGRGDTICVGAHNEGSKGNFELSAPPVISIKSPEVGHSTPQAPPFR